MNGVVVPTCGAGGGFFLQIINAVPFLQMLVCMVLEIRLVDSAKASMGAEKTGTDSTMQRTEHHPSIGAPASLSIVSRVCLLPVFQWLGGVSMSIYLVHEVCVSCFV